MNKPSLLLCEFNGVLKRASHLNLSHGPNYPITKSLKEICGLPEQTATCLQPSKPQYFLRNVLTVITLSHFAGVTLPSNLPISHFFLAWHPGKPTIAPVWLKKPCIYQLKHALRRLCHNIRCSAEGHTLHCLCVSYSMHCPPYIKPWFCNWTHGKYAHLIGVAYSLYL